MPAGAEFAAILRQPIRLKRTAIRIKLDMTSSREGGLCMQAVLKVRMFFSIIHPKIWRTAMPLIKPVSDLRNYPAVLRDVKSGSPVYLTKNGTGRYVLLDISDYSAVETALQLNVELMRGRLSGERDGWIGKAGIRKHLAEKANV